MAFYRLSILVLTIAIGGAVCPAQILPGAQRDSQTFTLSGVVVNSVTNQPIRRALVEMYARQPRAVLTDSEGHFSFDGLNFGSYSLTARKPGYFSETEVSRGRRGNFQVMVGPDTGSLTVKLLPEAVVTGSILDGDGLPVPRLRVQLLRREIVEGRGRWQPMQIKPSDENGNYRISGLLPGTYVIAAGPQSMPVALFGRPNGRAVGFRQIFFPNSDNMEGAAKLSLLPGQRVEANFSLAAEPFYKVRGSFSGDVANVYVMLVAEDAAGIANSIGLAQLEGANQFESDQVPPGNYRLIATGADTAGRSVQGDVPVTVRKDVLTANVALQPLLTVPIEVEARHVATKPTETPGVIFGSPGAQSGRQQYGYFQLNPRESWHIAGTVSGSISDHGNLPNVSPGRYSLQWNTNPPWYIDSITRDSTDLLVQDLAVSASGEQSPIRFLLRDDGAILKPQLQSSLDEGQFATMLLVPDGAPPTAIREYQIPWRGEAYLPPLKPGSYTLLAFEDVSNLEYTAPEALAPYLSRGAHVTLTAEQTTNVQLDLIRRSEP
jgi:hypothetical protein